MLLTIDAGNTNIVFSIYDDGVQRGAWRCATNPRRTADEYAAFLSHLMSLQQFDFSDIQDVIIASVVPAATFNLRRLCRDHLDRDPMVIGDPGVELGIEARIDRPEEAGADRLVNAVAAAAAYKPPLMVVDFGTATTFDVVDSAGNYRGGVICPGINLSLDALHMAAAKLPRVEILKPAKVIGTGTVGAMQSGIFWGYVGLIEGLVARIREEYGEPMAVVGTGGLVTLFADATPVIEHVDRELTLRGLLLIHERNRRKP